jgi:protein-S-isoprenylcysteine O-methyltransferase Ste14
MIAPLTVVVVLWIIWMIGWWLSARWTTTTVERGSASSHFSHSIFIWAAAFLLITRSRVIGPLLRPIMPEKSWAGWLGVALVAIGLGFAVWARVHLGRLWSAAVTLKSGHAVVRSGPYAIVRHPIYSGLLLAIIGTALARDNWAGLLAFVLAAVGLTVKLRQEERLLVEHLGAEYELYREQIPALLPRPWRRVSTR